MLQLNSFTLVFGILSIVLGAVGYFKKGSKASLIAGGISGVIILLGWYLMQHGSNPLVGQILTAVITVALLGRFLPSFLKSKTIMPAGIMAVCAVVEIVLLVQRFLA